MKMQIMSDIHTEFHMDNGVSFFESIKTDADILVVAGDIGNLISGKAGFTFLRLASEHYKHTVFVLGNHDYYHSDIAELVDNERELKYFISSLNKNSFGEIHWLENDIVLIDGHRFLGCTLWFIDKPEVHAFKGMINDYRAIKNFEPWVYQRSVESRDFLLKNVQSGDIVITHHLPHSACVSPGYKEDRGNCFYVNQLPDKLLMRPRFWFYGHSHSTRIVQAGETIVRSNPFGYVGRDINLEFEDHLIIDI